ncbi:hypothetical protein HYPBUDRAFT_153362 [Hyphopichia burtonii NRRL Y-1933]|uniref:RanBD1 domain-containing protein n=1 Tax=Hyphopichia burtonii NRRL Y-1933 TaxID=984485 RepID=A0A1E4RHM1_9ASCO|nr:hypothetical protein HYPBUDRAFT_153362 [Hyphopichia burtonii NRRL Y-1933]ODV66605.1 hypothetical protein HYPBUDRAFT_153362 [Hyphopichia burtonii NRRL Y-1933]
MAKRGAADQITKDNHDVSLDNEDPTPVVTASADVMAKRKILKPRGRGNATSTFSFKPKPSSTPSAFGNAFANAAPNAGGLFSSNNSSTANASSDKHAQIKALNDKFVDQILKANKPGTVANFSAIAKKYVSYYEDIEKKFQEESLGHVNKKQHQAPSTSSSAAPPSNGFSFGGSTPSLPVKPKVPESTTQQSKESDSESEEEEVKVEGPQFTLASKPTVKKSPFTFGPKPTKKPSSDSDSESEVEIKGPSFTFNKQIKDDVFKLNNTPKENNSTKPSFKFGSQANNDDDSKPNPFGFLKQGEKKEEPKPAFSFGAKPAEEKKEEAKPAFSFGSKPAGDSKPAFSFGAKPAEEKKDESKPAFSFTPKPAGDSKPAFSFGAKPAEEKKDESMPPFSFGAKPAEEKKEEPKPAFSFGAKPAEEKKEEPKPAFSFGAKPAGDSKPAFSFGAKPAEENKDESKPAFSFGAKPAEASKPFSFNSSSKPFTFGSSDEKKDDQPKSLFQGSDAFGTKPSTENPLSGLSKPAFNFGSSATSSKPFGGSAGFNFGASSNNQTNNADSSKQESELVPEEETGGDFKPVGSLSNEKIDTPSTGEENEEVLFEKKTKLMLFDASNTANPYTSKGLGDLKVLKNKETNKSRILVRAEGGLRVLLNTSINKDMIYDTIGNGSLVRVPTINPDDKSIETFVMKVKTPDDGKNLLSAINNAKQ